MSCLPCYQTFLANVPTAIKDAVYENLDKHLNQPLDAFQAELDSAMDFLQEVDAAGSDRLADFNDSVTLQQDLEAEVINQGIDLGDCPQIQTLLSQVELFTGLSKVLYQPMQMQIRNMQAQVGKISTAVSSMNILIAQAEGLKC